jgi:hypothetical protein
MNAMNIDVGAGRLVAFASSEGPGRSRWSELRVWHVPLARRPWVSEARACSDLPGEQPRANRMASADLERALRLFDDTELGTIVKETAREWASEEGVPAQGGHARKPADDHEALAMLFGVEGGDLAVRPAADALGMGESSVRMALRSGRELRVPLRALFPFIDRAAFQRARHRQRDAMVAQTEADHG